MDSLTFFNQLFRPTGDAQFEVFLMQLLDTFLAFVLRLEVSYDHVSQISNNQAGMHLHCMGQAQVRTKR